MPGFPSFTRLGAALDKSALAYNPTGELIFPSILHVAGRVQNPLGAWYMYYAPHDAPGGICLAYADSLAGPWREHPGNPIIARTWSPHYSVSHVSSPHAVWNAADRRVYLYFHGENTTTRVATSADGRSFAYGGTVLVVYHGGSGAIHVAHVGTSFDRENHLGVLYTEPVATRAAAPSFAEEGGRLHMFYEAGRRGNTNIAIARAS